MTERAARYFLTWTEGAVGVGHLAAALIALAAGLVVLLLRKGARAHVAAGYAYVAAMLTVNGSALMKYDLTGAPNLFHAAALASLATLAGAGAASLAYRRTRRKSAAAAHGIFMIWSYFGLVIALVAEVVTRRFPYLLHGDGGWTRFTLATGALMLAAGALTHRYARREVRKTLGA